MFVVVNSQSRKQQYLIGLLQIGKVKEYFVEPNCIQPRIAIEKIKINTKTHRGFGSRAKRKKSPGHPLIENTRLEGRITIKTANDLAVHPAEAKGVESGQLVAQYFRSELVNIEHEMCVGCPTIGD